MVALVIVGLSALVLGILIGFAVPARKIVWSTQFCEKLYAERQQALALAAEATNAYNQLGGKRGQQRRIITPGEFDAKAGVLTQPRSQGA
jgi:type II secretory pathway pseudopilin PulG